MAQKLMKLFEEVRDGTWPATGTSCPLFSNPVATSDERRVSDVWGSLLVAAAPFPTELSPAVTVLVAYANIVTNRDSAEEDADTYCSNATGACNDRCRTKTVAEGRGRSPHSEGDDKERGRELHDGLTDEDEQRAVYTKGYRQDEGRTRAGRAGGLRVAEDPSAASLSGLK